MANWCVVYGRFVGAKENLERFRNDFLEAQKIHNPNASQGWLGNLLLYNNDLHDNFRGLRGFIVKLGDIVEDKEHNDFYIEHVSEDAWDLAVRYYEYVVNKYNLEFYYFLIEHGLGYYETNDRDKRFFSERYVLEVVFMQPFDNFDFIEDIDTRRIIKKLYDNEGYDYFDTFDELEAYVKNEFGFESFDSLYEFVEETLQRYDDLHDAICVSYSDILVV